MEEVARAELGTYGRMILLAPAGPVYPGQDVVGQVTLQLRNHPFLLRGLWCKLSGVCVVSHQEKEVACVDLLQGDEDHHGGGVVEVLAGFGEADLNDHGELLELSEASYTWPYSFKIPPSAPFSHADRVAEVLYTLACALDSPAVCKADAQLHHTLVVGCTGPEARPPFVVPRCVLDAYRPTIAPAAAAPSADEDDEMAALDSQAAAKAWSLPAMLRRWVRGGVKGGAEEPALTLTSDRPAVFAFAKTRLVLPLSAALQLPRALRARLSTPGQAPVRLTARVVLQTCLRKDAFAAFSARGEAEMAEVDSAKSLWGKRRHAAVRQVLWESTRDLVCRPLAAQQAEGEGSLSLRFEVPLKIDPTHREACLSSWPRPAPITHDAASDPRLAACLYSFTSESPLFRLRYLVEVEAWREIKAGRRATLCRRRAEIFVHPPLHAARTVGSSSSGSGGSGGAGPASDGLPPRVAVPPTPHASLAPLRVVGELLSRGPAALLMDRGSGAPNQQFVTPQRFAHLHQVAQGVEVVPGTPAFTPAIAFLLSPRPHDQDQPPAFALALEVDGGEGQGSPVLSPAADSLRLVSPVPLAAGATIAATAAPETLEESAPPADASPALLALYLALPPRGALLARLQSQTAYHTLPRHALAAADAAALLQQCTSSADREGVLFLLLREACLEPGADVELLAPGGCVDACFPVAVQRGRFNRGKRAYRVAFFLVLTGPLASLLSSLSPSVSRLSSLLTPLSSLLSPHSSLLTPHSRTQSASRPRSA